MLTAAKDRLSSQAAHAFVSERLRRYGTLEKLTIDSARRRIELVVRLDGESSSVAVTVERYETVQHGGGTALRVVESTASRAWLAAVLRDHLHGRPLPLPGWAAALL